MIQTERKDHPSNKEGVFVSPPDNHREYSTEDEVNSTKTFILLILGIITFTWGLVCICNILLDPQGALNAFKSGCEELLQESKDILKLLTP